MLQEEQGLPRRVTTNWQQLREARANAAVDGENVPAWRGPQLEYTVAGQTVSLHTEFTSSSDARVLIWFTMMP